MHTSAPRHRRPLLMGALVFAALVLPVVFPARTGMGGDEAETAHALPPRAAAALAEFRKVPWKDRLKPEHGATAPDGWQQGVKAEWELGSLDAEHLPALEALLTDEDRFVRVLAARSIGLVGEPSATPALAKLLVGESDPIILCTVVQALARTGGDGALEAVESLQKPGINADVQRHVGFARRQLKGGRWDLASIRGEHADALSTEISAAKRHEPAPELGLPSPVGPVNLSVFADHVIVLAFVHGDLGPLDNRVLARLELLREFLDLQQIEVIVVVPHEKERAQIWREKTKLRLRIACDPAGRAAAAYGVAKQLFSGSEWLPSPAWFVIDRKGRVAWSRVGTKMGDHASLGDLKPVLEDVVAGLEPDE